MNYPEKRPLQFFVAGRHPAELLQLAEEPLDPVALAVRLLVQPARRVRLALKGITGFAP